MNRAKRASMHRVAARSVENVLFLCISSYDCKDISVQVQCLEFVPSRLLRPARVSSFASAMPFMKKPAALKKPAASEPRNEESDGHDVPDQEMSLEDKIAKWKETHPEERSAAPDLTMDEWRKVNGRAKTAMKDNEEAQKAWEEASTATGPGTVNKKKRNFLVAFLLDPKFGPGFQKCTQEVVSSNKSKTVLKPETWKELLKRYEEDEIHALLDAGVIYEKSDARCPGVMKYIDTSQVSETKTVDKRFSMGQGVAKALKGDTNAGDATAMQEWQDCWSKFKPGTGLSSFASELHGTGNDKPNDHEAKPNEKDNKEAKVKRSAFDRLCDEINSLENVSSAKSKATGIKTLLDSMISKLDTMQTKGKTSKYWTTKVKKDFNALHNNMKNASEKCKSLIVSNKLKLEAMQNELLRLAEILRDSSNSLTSHGRVFS